MLARVPRPLRAGTSKVILGIKPRLLDTVAALGRALLPGRRGATPVGDKLHKAARVMGLDSPDDVYRTLVSHWQDPGEIVVGAGEEARSLDLPPEHAGADPVRRMMVLDMLGYLPDDILVKVDRAAMAVSLESRVPLLDHRLVEFASTLPVEILRRHGQSKWPLRQILYKHVPRDMIERPKAGFAVPLAAWLRGPLRDWAENLMGERRLESEGYLRSAPIRDAWGQLLAGAASNQERIWNVLMFQAWLDSTSANAGHLGPLPAAASAT